MNTLIPYPSLHQARRSRILSTLLFGLAAVSASLMLIMGSAAQQVRAVASIHAQYAQPSTSRYMTAANNVDGNTNILLVGGIAVVILMLSSAGALALTRRGMSEQ